MIFLGRVLNKSKTALLKGCMKNSFKSFSPKIYIWLQVDSISELKEKNCTISLYL
jgi:hypothetical protein